MTIELKNIRLALGAGESRVEILKGISLSISKGETVGLIGASGSGKSTLLMVMAGLERADDGDIRIQGENLTQMSEDELARFRGRHVGVVFQSFHLLPTMTAVENVAVPLEMAGTKDAYERAEAELMAVGLGHRLHHYPAQLSGGEQQRVAIARALVVRPAIVFADEPTGNLDEKTGGVIADLLFGRVRALGSTLVMVTHDAEMAARCDRVVRVYAGEIVP